MKLDPKTIVDGTTARLLINHDMKLSEATPEALHDALASTLMEHISRLWSERKQARSRERHAYYFSAEYLIGRLIYSNLYNLGLLDEIRAKGIPIVDVLLHVGLGTFRPVSVENVEEHHMHSEHYEVTEEAADTINRVRRNGGRIVCVGTTTTRTLESVTDDAGVVRRWSRPRKS